MTETMGVAIGIGVFALVFIYLGCLMWKKEKITLLHSYHYDKVSPSDKKVFCKISGWGVIFIGIGLLVTAIIIGITDSTLSFIAFVLGFVVLLYTLLFQLETKYTEQKTNLYCLHFPACFIQAEEL